VLTIPVNLNTIIEILPLATFVIALVTLIVTLANFFRNKAKIKVLQIQKGTTYILKPDRDDSKNPDVYWNKDYRILADIVITNNSALPISIIEFKLNDDLIFNSYTQPGNTYTVTIRPFNNLDKNGIIFARGDSLSKVFEMKDSYIQPVFDIPPYTSIRGHLFFHYNDESKAQVGKNILKVVTSRRVFTSEIEIYESVHSALELPKDIQKDRNQSFD
jgi:hypothetical protein